MTPPKAPSHSRQSSYANSEVARSLLHQRESDNDNDDDLDEVEGKPDVENGRMRQMKGDRDIEDVLDEIGFGPYQLRLLILCGLGWLSDNATLQCIAVILPRVQTHFNLSSTAASLLSASTMFGMMLGAAGWGSASDNLGRSLAFHSTIFLTGIFNLGASYVGSFEVLCVWMFFLGTAVGGSMPTDGTLFLENLPQKKQYLLTFLSVFFSLGAVLSSVIALFVLPEASCDSAEGCDVAGGANDGWRRLLFILAIIDFVMFIARSVLFRMHESPRFLLANSRSTEAAHVLDKIAVYNQVPDFQLDMGVEQSEPLKSPVRRRDNSPYRLSEDRASVGSSRTSSSTPRPVHDRLNSSTRIQVNGNGKPNYSKPPDSPIRATVSDPALQRHRSQFFTPSEELSGFDWTLGDKRDKNARRGSVVSALPVESNIAEEDDSDDDDVEAPVKPKSGYAAWAEKFQIMFGPKWRRTTVLMWIIWAFMALAYGMFNVWLPTVLEQRSKDAGATLYDALLEYLWYSVAGCPGSILGAWAIETSLGRRRSLALFTILTAMATFAFTRTTSQWAVIVSSCILGNAATTMYAILYGMSPEIFDTEIRGTAVGSAAALSRLSGILAPILAGFLLAIAPALPLLGAAGIFAVTAVCALLLPFERSAGGKSGGGGFAH